MWRLVVGVLMGVLGVRCTGSEALRADVDVVDTADAEVGIDTGRDADTSTSTRDTNTSTSLEDMSLEDTSTSTSLEDTSTSTSPEDTSTSTSPEDTSLEDTSTSPEDTSTSTSLEDTSPDDTSTSTSPEDTSPEDTSAEDTSTSTSTSTSPEDTSPEDTSPEDTSTSTSPEDTSTSTSPEDTTTPPEDTSPEDTSTSTSPEDTSPEDTSPEDTSPEDTTTPPEDTSPEDTTTPPEDTSPEDTSPEDTSPEDTATPPEDTTTPPEDTGPEDASVSVRGRILYEVRRPNAARTALGAVVTTPLAGREVLLRVGASPLGVVTTDADGTFTLSLSSAPGAPVTATVVAASPVASPDAIPTFTLLDAVDTVFPSAQGQPLDSRRVWAWTFTSPEGSTDLGEVVITAALGSGALALLFDLEEALARFVELALAHELIADPTDLPTLGVLWHPSRTPPCLSCYFPEPWGPIRLVSAQGAVITVFERGLFLSGAAAAPHHWTPSLSGHELGHYVTDVVSRLPSSSGAHSWNTRVSPPLAWSEGLATFFAQWSLSEAAPDSRFFTMQQNIQYWVDLERIGTSPTTDDTSLAMTFPLPQPTQPMTQDMNEAIIAAILWDLYDPVDAAVDLDTLEHGDDALARIALTRLATPTQDRGALGPDLVDYIDALVCFGLTWAELQPEMLGFPWTGPALCPP